VQDIFKHSISYHTDQKFLVHELQLQQNAVASYGGNLLQQELSGWSSLHQGSNYAWVEASGKKYLSDPLESPQAQNDI
jgi:hypothetical protein